MGEKQKRFSLKTKEGCQRLLGLFIIVILVCSLLARVVSTEGGKIKVEELTFDARRAALSAELYYPAGTSTQDSLPAVIVTPGGGCTYGVTRGIALEIARRGFVVLNVSAYGAGLSEMPPYDDNDMGVDEYIDSDSDILPDYWEYEWFGNLSYDGTDDPDSDGATNLEEYRYGTDPNDPGDYPVGGDIFVDDDSGDDEPEGDVKP